MKKKYIILSSLIILLTFCPNAVAENNKARSGNENVHTWEELLAAKEYADADKLCSDWARSDDRQYLTEAYKCLANLALINSSMMYIEKNDRGGLMRGGYTQEATERAIGYLEKGIDLSPDDLSIHQGRLHVLMMAGRYHDTAGALEDSLKRYSGEDALESWLDYSPRFYSAGQFDAGITFLKVLEQKYPVEHRIKANIGAFLAMLERDEEALEYSREAVNLNPDDPINNWNLGRLYDYTGRIKDAEKYYSKSIELMKKNNDTGNEYFCIYAGFTYEKLNARERVCSFFKEYCPKESPEECD